MRVHVKRVIRVIMPLDEGLETEGLGQLRHGSLGIIELVARNALRHEYLALLANHAVEGCLGALVAAYATIRAEILQIGQHCAARLERGASDSCSDGYLLLYRQRARASLVTVCSVLPGDEKHNLVTVSLDRNGEKTATFLAEWTVKLLAVESVHETGFVTLQKESE